MPGIEPYRFHGNEGAVRKIGSTNDNSNTKHKNRANQKRPRITDQENV